MAITGGRASNAWQTLTGTGTWDTLFDAASHGPPVVAVEVFAKTQGVIVRVHGVHDRNGSTIDEFLIDAGASQAFGAKASEQRRITKIEAKAASAGAETKWTVTFA